MVGANCCGKCFALTDKVSMAKRAAGNGNGATANRPALTVKTDDKGRIFSHIRQNWLVETPEERVRQAYVVTLYNEYGFDLAQMDEELHVAGRGSARARADAVIWRTAQDKADAKAPLIVVECKSDNITIKTVDYAQGEAYSLYCNAPFFVTHNNRETRYWRTRKERMPGHCEEIENIPHADASDKEIQELIAKLKTFKEDEFADLLHSCHNVIRNREHLDPAAAFDEIAKVLFVKVYVERELRSRRHRRNIFDVDYLREQLGDDPVNDLFQKTKREFQGDRIFAADDRINLRPATTEKIVELLQKYNLSDTSEDVKGIAFERFLGRTFRGEIGQFFTPRSIVEFMVSMMDPREGEIVCDPASGSGGFLIRVFEVVRQRILADVDAQYQQFKRQTEEQWKRNDKIAPILRERYEQLQLSLDQRRGDSRMWRLANRCIYGTDANDRMARTSKMNMILHGDGHGGVHHHNGFININGIFEERFDMILTNPPFGANVEPSDVITDDQIGTDPDSHGRYVREYGDLYKQAQRRIEVAKGKPIASLFELPSRNGVKLGKVKTEILFIERCLSLLKPGGRMSIVLPEGIFNNPSLAYVREFCEDRSRVLAVVSLPQETFYSSGATVKASLLFLAKYTEQESADFAAKRDKTKAEVEAKYAGPIAAEMARLQGEIDAASAAKDKAGRKAAEGQLKQYLAKMQDTKSREARALLKERFDYPIFLYEAEKVGITATGEPDANELYPNANLPAGVKAEDTCLELYRRFQQDPNLFALEVNHE
jgi:type I restriction enzyme M protein